MIRIYKIVAKIKKKLVFLFIVYTESDLVN